MTTKKFQEKLYFLFLIFNGVQLIQLHQFQVHSKVNPLYIYIYPLFFQILFPYRSLQSIEQSSLCYTVGSYQLSIFYIVVCICQYQPSNLSSPTPYLSFFFGQAAWHAGSQFPYQGSNPRPLQWKHRVLTTGPPGKSQGKLQMNLLICANIEYSC